MDKDGSGSISKTEVMVALQRVNVFLTTEETCRLMETLVGDQSGKISEKSIIDFWNVSQVASELEEHQKLQGVTQTHKTDVTDSKESIPDVRVVVYTTDQKEFIPPDGHISRLDDRYTDIDLPEDSSVWTVEESAAGLKHWASGTVSIIGHPVKWARSYITRIIQRPSRLKVLRSGPSNTRCDQSATQGANIFLL
jgi:hypothetical protein